VSQRSASSAPERDLAALIRELPAPVCSPERREGVRTALMAALAQMQPAVAGRRRSTRLVVVVAGALALGGAGLIVRRSPPPAPVIRPAPTLQPAPEAPAAPRVIPPAPEPAPQAQPPRPATTHRRRAVEGAFDQGWSALRAGRPAQAAAAFERALARDARHPLAADASFWRAVALIEAKQPEQGLAALEVFLTRFPDSERAARAATMAGWLLLDAGNLPAARARFQAAAADPAAEVARSARAGLAAIERRQPGPGAR
jgi:TolA-binding protein